MLPYRGIEGTRWLGAVRPGSRNTSGLHRGRQARIVVPDVGGGFGWKEGLPPEEVALGRIAMRAGLPCGGSKAAALSRAVRALEYPGARRASAP